MYMRIKEGKYLICILRKNGDFYKYYLTDDFGEAVDKFYIFKEEEPSKTYGKYYVENNLKKLGIVNHYTRPNLYLIDLEATDEMVESNVSLYTKSQLSKFKRIKRLYKLNLHLC